MDHPIRRYLAAISAKLELPADLIAGIPKLEMTGDQELLLEQHNGVAHYSDTSVTVRTSLGIVRITGTDLYIRRMNNKLLVIRGRLHSVGWEGNSS